MSRYIKVITGDENGEGDMIVMRRDGITALDVLGFMQDIAALFDMEALAQAEGRTLNHPFARGVGALPIVDAAKLRELSERIASSVQTEAD